jgi:tripartite-type tricarboxylate transporter receptor subunit TctC
VTLPRRRFLQLAGSVAAALPAAARVARAQTYPTRSIRIVVPATPGGAIDVIARLVADKLTAALGQSVVVENKPGASNNLGTDAVAMRPTSSCSSSSLTIR